VKLKWTRPAAADRRQIREYIVPDSPVAALDLDEQFERNAALLLNQPGMGRPGRVAGTHKWVAHRN
jgi:plasmid stabilization system protein ParE